MERNSHSAAIASAVTQWDGVSWGEVCGAGVIGPGEYWMVEQYGQLWVMSVVLLAISTSQLALK